MKVLRVLAVLASTVCLCGKETPPKSDDHMVILEPMKITGTPIISYAIDIWIYQDPATKKVDRIFISKVWPNTDAAAAGLQVGDEILRIDGVPVKDFPAAVSVDSRLGKLFLNRRPGDPLKLEVLTRRAENVTLRAQRPTLEDNLR